MMIRGMGGNGLDREVVDLSSDEEEQHNPRAEKMPTLLRPVP